MFFDVVFCPFFKDFLEGENWNGKSEKSSCGNGRSSYERRHRVTPLTGEEHNLEDYRGLAGSPKIINIIIIQKNRLKWPDT